LKKKRQDKNKLWLDRRSRKIQHDLSTNEKSRKNRNSGDVNIKASYKRNRSDSNRVIIPTNFSLIENPYETIQCFETMEAKLRLKIETPLNLDFYEVENLSIDAIMYLIAFTQNKAKQGNQRSIKGNYPKNKQAKTDMISSGFLDFVSQQTIVDKEQLKKDDTLMITVGHLVKPEILADICDFVNKAFKTPTRYTGFLYTIIGELMANTNEHAYVDVKAAKKTVNRWYLFVKKIDTKIKFTILDTGIGIPATINKRVFEKIRDQTRILPTVSDSNYIFEALQGKHKSNFSRSRTAADNRNKGLPAIYNCYQKGLIRNFKIMSNSGVCYCVDGTSQKSDLDKRLQGTLFYWEIENHTESEA